MRRRHRRKNARSTMAEEPKEYRSSPTNPGRDYSPVHHHNRNPSMEQHPTVPLMAAGAIPHGHQSQAPSLSQHPAIRAERDENPFADPKTHHNGTHRGLEEGLVGGAAAGAAGYGMHKHHQHQNKSIPSHAAPAYTQTPHSHHGLEEGLAGSAATGAAGYGMHKHHQHEKDGFSHTPTHAQPLQSQPFLSQNDQSQPMHSHHDLEEGLAGGPVAGAAGYGMHKHHQNEERQRLRKSEDRSRSRSHSRPSSGAYVSGALPTHNTDDRPPTPFGLSGIGQPYEDMHVHVLQTEAPSRDLRHSLRNRVTPFPSSTYNDPNHPVFRNSRGYSTPPEVPSRSPNRANRASNPTFADSSYESSLSNTTTPSYSSGEGYTPQRDPYQPAHHNRTSSSVAPWEQHQNRYSNTPPTSTTVSPPPIPWEANDYAQQRRQSHSPRQSHNSNGFTGVERRRASQSPGATSINGQPRRLRFEDLQSGGGNDTSYPGAYPHDSYDGHEHARWSQGVGEAL